jgi:hypothetical protein
MRTLSSSITLRCTRRARAEAARRRVPARRLRPAARPAAAMQRGDGGAACAAFYAAAPQSPDGRTPDAAGRRLQLPVPRLPRDARPALARRLPHRRHPRHGGDDEVAARALPGRARGLRLRRQRPDLPRRLVPRVQGPPLADARGPAQRRSSPSTRWCACSAGRCWWCPASRPTTPSARWRASAAAAGHRVLISTGDKDLAQLVTPQVSLINTMAKPPEVLDEAGV